jgi:penicillin-binding protein 2
MPKENEKQRVLSRRALIFGGLQMAAFSALAGRLYYLQFIKSEELYSLSENNRIKLQLVAPPRGNILDRHGKPMASSDINYRLFLDYSTLTQQSFQSTVAHLNGLLPLPDKKLAQLKSQRVSTAAMPDMLRDHLSWDEVAMLELNMMDLPGVMIDLGQIRTYPLADEAAHLLGYLGAVAEEDLSEDDPPLMRLPDFKIGKNGIEKMLEDRLRGTAGIRQLEVNVHGMPVREIGKTPPVAGENIRLTIDARLQKYASDLIKNESASVVVMEVDTGNVLTLASMPAFDPNVFSKGISSEYWKELSRDKKAPLLNKSIAGQYPPGSTFKMLVGLAGLEEKLITPDTRVFCPGHFMLGNHKFNCWKEGGHGHVNYHEAVAQSCDTFFYTLAQRMGIEPYADMARRFGLGQTHNIGLLGEKAGIIPGPDWKMKRYKQRWTGGDTINASIGQGYVLSTPLQLAVMAARMASGLNVVPRLHVPEGEERPEFSPIKLDEEWLRLNMEAMNAVCNSQTGTAYGKRIIDPRFAMGGKTGTSQVRRILQRGQDQKTLPWEARHHALFVAYAPITNPKYACCVVVEHGGGGAAAAAPIARDVLLRLQQWEAGIEPAAPSAPAEAEPPVDDGLPLDSTDPATTPAPAAASDAPEDADANERNDDNGLR